MRNLGKLLAAMSLAIVLQVGFSGGAQAAEIPPTEECVATFKVAFKAITEEREQARGPKQMKAADLKFARTLADADCVTETEPLIKDVKVEPFAERCAVAAKAADEFWAPTSRRLDRAKQDFDRRQVTLAVRIGVVTFRISALRERGASAKRIRPLIKKKQRLNRRDVRQFRAFMRTLHRLVAPQEFANALVYFELGSLRCIGDFADGELGATSKKDPVGRLLAKHELLVYGSLYFTYIDSGVRLNGRSSQAGVASALPLDQLFD